MSGLGKFDKFWRSKGDEALLDAFAHIEEYEPESRKALQRESARRKLDAEPRRGKWADPNRPSLPEEPVKAAEPACAQERKCAGFVLASLGAVLLALLHILFFLPWDDAHGHGAPFGALLVSMYAFVDLVICGAAMVVFSLISISSGKAALRRQENEWRRKRIAFWLKAAHTTLILGALPYLLLLSLLFH